MFFALIMLKNVKRDVKKLPVSDDLCRQESKLLVQETILNPSL